MGRAVRASHACGLTLLVSLVGCAGGSALRTGSLAPESISALEAARARRPGDPGTLTRLGVAYYASHRLVEARDALGGAVLHGERHGTAALYLGMASEALADFTTARLAYTFGVAVARDRDVREQADRRLALVRRNELEFNARQTLAREALLSPLPAESNAVVVMPFSYSGTDPGMRLLAHAFAQLVVTDLLRSGRVRVLERERLEAIAKELLYADSADADPGAAVRADRLLRASRVVQGTLSDSGMGLRVDAVVVDRTTTTVTASVTSSEGTSHLFALARQTALAILAGLGHQLTEEERSALDETR
jgi:TolB-like protein